MRHLTYIILFLTAILISMTTLNSCEECGECFTPPGTILLVILDDSTGSNLLRPGAYDPDSIKISNTLEFNNNIGLTFYGNDSSRIMSTGNLSWEGIGGPKTFYLYLNSTETDTILLNVVVVNDDCCTWHNLEQFDINGTQAEWDDVRYTFVLRK